MALATRGIGGQCLIHDAANSPRATAALGAAAEAMVDLASGARSGLAGRQRRAHVMVGNHIAGADDHCGGRARDIGTICNYL